MTGTKRTAAALLLLATTASPVGAQLYTLPATINVAMLATKAEVEALQATACPPGSTVPPAETVGGSAGVMATCLRSDARLPRVSRSMTIATTAGGVFTGTWSVPLPTAPTIILTPVATGAVAVHCELTALPTTTTFAGRCVTISVASILAVAAGQQVQVFAIPPTQ